MDDITNVLLPFDELATLKAVSTSDDMYRDEEGNYIIFRTVGGRVVPIRSSVEDFISYLEGIGIPLDPADQSTIRKVENDLWNMSTYAEDTGWPLEDLHTQYIKNLEAMEESAEGMPDEDYQRLRSYHELKKQRDSILRQAYNRLSERQSSATGEEVETLEDKKKEIYEAYLKEEGGVKDARDLEDKGWESLIESNTDFGIDDATGQAMKVFGLLARRVLDEAKQGRDVSGLTLDKVLAQEIDDLGAQKKFFNTDYLTQHFQNNRELGYLVLGNGRKILERNLEDDAPAADAFRERFQEYVDGIARDFPPPTKQQKSERRDTIASLEAAKILSDARVKVPEHLPLNYGGEAEGRALMESVRFDAVNPRTVMQSVAGVTRHLGSRLLGELSPEHLADFSETNRRRLESVTDGASWLDGKHRDGWQSYFTGKSDPANRPERMLSVMVSVADEAIQDFNTNRDANNLLRALDDISFMQGKIDAYLQYKTRGEDFFGKRGNITKGWEDFNKSDTLASSLLPALFEKDGDPSQRLASQLLSNKTLGLRHIDPPKDGGRGSTSTINPDPVVLVEEKPTPRFSLTPGKRGNFTGPDGYSSQVMSASKLDTVVGSDTVSGEGNRAMVLYGPEGEALAAVKFPAHRNASEIKAEEERVLSKLDEYIEAIRNAPEPVPDPITEAEGAPDLEPDSAALNGYDANFRVTNYTAMDEESRGTFERFRNELAHYEGMVVTPFAGGEGIAVHDPDRTFNLTLRYGENGLDAAFTNLFLDQPEKPVTPEELLTELDDLAIDRSEAPVVELGDLGKTGLPATSNPDREAIRNAMLAERDEESGEVTFQSDQVGYDYEEMANQLTGEGGGFTQPLFPNQETPTSGFMVGLVGSGRKIPTSEVSPEAVQSYVSDNDGKKFTRQDYLGGWTDRDNGQTYLDISRNFQDREEALKLARETGELSIYDIDNGEEIGVSYGETQESEEEVEPEATPEPEIEDLREPRPTPSPHDVSHVTPNLIGEDDSLMDRLDRTFAKGRYMETPRSNIYAMYMEKGEKINEDSGYFLVNEPDGTTTSYLHVTTPGGTDYAMSVNQKGQNIRVKREFWDDDFLRRMGQNPDTQKSVDVQGNFIPEL